MTKELKSFKESVQDGFYPGYFYSDQVENPLAMATMEHTHEAIRTAMDNLKRLYKRMVLFYLHAF